MMKGKEMKMVHMLAFLLVVIGGLNWLLVGVVQWDIGQLLGGQDNIISRAIYVAVGLAAVYLLVTHKKDCQTCSAKDEEAAGNANGGRTDSSMPS